MSVGDLVKLSYIAKGYYDFVMENDNSITKSTLFGLSLHYVENKQYATIFPGYKERCMDILDDTLETACDSDMFYQKILVSASCCEIITRSLYNILEDMLVYCQDRVKQVN